MKKLLLILFSSICSLVYAQDTIQEINRNIRVSNSEFLGAPTSIEKIEAFDFDGKPVIIDSLTRTPYVINSWAMWCAPCIAEIPAFNQLFEFYKNQSVDFYAVSLTQDKEITLNYLKNHPYSFKQLTADREFVESKLAVGFPTTYFVDKSGKIVYSIYGGFTEPEKQVETIKKFKIGMGKLGCR